MEPRIGFLKMGPLAWEFGALIIRLLLLEDGYFLHDNFFTVYFTISYKQQLVVYSEPLFSFSRYVKHVKHDKNVPLIHRINNQRIYQMNDFLSQTSMKRFLRAEIPVWKGRNTCSKILRVPSIRFCQLTWMNATT